jgi:sugar/nucleoside kinase (ribokinase family)
MTKRILTVGNPVLDIIVTPAVARAERVLSGCSTNAALAVSKMGEFAFLVGSVGEDFRARLEGDLSSHGIEYLLMPSRQTGGFHLVYDERGNRDLTILGIADAVPVFEDGRYPWDFMLIGPILGETSPALVARLREISDAPIMLDPQGLLRNPKAGVIYHELTDSFKQIAKMATVIKANELETLIITGINPRVDPEGAVKALYDCGGKIAVTTLAEAGSIIYDGACIYQIPPFVTNAIDPTGAGDTYAAGFMVKYLESPRDLAAVGCFASAVASVMVENSGPEFPLTRAEADRRQKLLLESPQKIHL